MAYTKQVWADDDVTKPVSAARMDHIEDGILNAHALIAAGGGGSNPDYGKVLVDTFPGSSDDARLTAACTAMAAETYPRTIMHDAREYTYNSVNRAEYEGMRIAGPKGYSNPERGGDKMGCRIDLNGTGPWFKSDSEIFTVTFTDLSFVGGTNSSVLGGTGNHYCLEMSGIYSSGLRSILGTYASKFLITAAFFHGTWEINNCYDTAFHLGGSDNTLWENGMLLDSGTAFNSAGGSAGHPHLWNDGLDKTTVGPLYITSEGNWAGIRHNGAALGSTSSNQGYVIYRGLRLEGRNPGAECNGPIFTQTGGIVEITSSWIAYAMAAGITASNKGVIQQSGGQLDVNGVTFDTGNSTDNTMPFIHTDSAGDCQVTRIKRASRGGAWGTNRPRVAKPAANAENRMIDGTVTSVAA